MKEILVIGSSGLVGSRFIELQKENYSFILPNEKELDITLKGSVDSYFANHPEIHTVVNFAAFTNVDSAEKERGDKTGFVWRLNVEAVRNIAQACQGKFLIQISTDFVFTGGKDNPGPYAEDAPTPQNSDELSWYGWTKLKGEETCFEENKNTAIVRISYPFRAFYRQKTDFARNFLSVYEEGKMYPLFSDQYLTPVFVDELTEALVKIINIGKNEVYHVASSNLTTPYLFAKYLLEKIEGKNIDLAQGSLEEFLKTPGKTPRPLMGGLKTEKTQSQLGFKFSSWEEAVDKLVKQLKEGIS